MASDAAMMARDRFLRGRPRPLALLALGLLLAGCVTSVAELRQQPPQRTGIAPGDYRTLARCTADELRAGPSSPWAIHLGDLDYDAVEREADAFARITGRMRVTSQPAPVIELVFRDRPPAPTAVELRWAYWWGDRIGDPAWSVVERCAGAPVSVTPPLESSR